MVYVPTSLGHFRGPTAARGRCLNLDGTLCVDIVLRVLRMEMRNEGERGWGRRYKSTLDKRGGTRDVDLKKSESS